MIKQIVMVFLAIFMLFTCSSCNLFDNETETISFNSYEVTLVCPEDESVNGSKLTTTMNSAYEFPKPTREHYVFEGWSIDGDLIEASGTWRYSKGGELVAVWRPVIYSDENTGLAFNILNDEYAVVVGYDYPGQAVEFLKIPDEYMGYPVTSIGNSAFYGLGRFVTDMLFIPFSVKTIENNAFYGCDSLPIKIYDKNRENEGLDYEGLGAEWLSNVTIENNNGALNDLK